MTHNLDQIEILKNSVVRSLFLDTADQTYVVARWCFLNRLFLDFYWNGLHAVEKYLKATLLLNGRSARINDAGKAYHHDLDLLLASVAGFAGEFLPTVLGKPTALRGVHWREESLECFVRRLNQLGDPNIRYNLFGFCQWAEDLYKLDRLVLAIRNVAQRLDGVGFNGSGAARAEGASARSAADLLRSASDTPHRLPSSRLGKLSSHEALPAVRRAALEHNLAFAPDDYEHGSRPSSWSGANSLLAVLILEPLENGASLSDALKADLADWVIANIYLPKAAKNQLAEASAQLRQRALAQ